MSTIITILSTDVVADSRADLNTNFANLNTDKAELVSPAFTTPDLGTPSAGVLTNCSGTASSLTAGAVTGLDITAGQTLTVTTGGTLGTGAYATIADYAPLAGAAFTGALSTTIADTGNVVGLTVTQNDTTNNPVGATITNAGTRQSLYIHQDGILDAGNSGLQVYSNAVQTTGDALAIFWQDNASTTIPSLSVRQDGTGNGLFIDQNGNGIGLNIDNDGAQKGLVVTNTNNAGSIPAAYFENDNAGATTNIVELALSSGDSRSNRFYRNLASAVTGGPVVQMWQDNATDDQPTVQIINDGTGSCLIIQQPQDVEVIDFDACTDGGTAHTTLAGSIKVQMPNGSTGYINLYT